MSIRKLACGLVCLAAMAAASVWAATAEGEWTKSTWSTFTASPDAISHPKYIAADRPYTDFIFCDGYANCEVETSGHLAA